MTLPRTESNALFFLLEGEMYGHFNEFRDKGFRGGDILYLPKYSAIEITSHTACRWLTCIFEVPHNVCNKLDFHRYAPLCEKIEYTMAPGTIRPQMQVFLDGLIYSLCNGISCEHYHELKQNEMFLIFRWFYSKEELALLFYPMIGRSLDFKAIVLGSHLYVKSVDDLAKNLNMSRSTFDSRFKQEFGMSAGQWMLKQKANHIRHYMSNPEVTISDAMIKFDFNSPTHFTRFCKQQFGTTPSELIALVRGK
jgi:AraC-like DNA-binding protein